MKDLSVLAKLVRPETRTALAKSLSVPPKTLEAVLKGKEENVEVLNALLAEARRALDVLSADFAALSQACEGAGTEPTVRVADPIHAATDTQSFSFALPASGGAQDLATEASENPNPLRPMAIQSRSWMERERLAKVIAGLSPYQFDFIKSQNGTYSKAYDHDLDLLAACFALHQQGYSKNGVVIFMKQNAQSVFDQEAAYSTLQRLQGDYIQHIRLSK
jgi:cytochrome c556